MFTKVSRNETRVRRHKRVRTKISGTPECPRLCVFRSNAHIHVQIIDDVNQNTLVSASSVDMKLENGGNVEAARLVARLQSLILLGRPRLFGLLGREENLTIPWQEIETIGTDAVLVHTQLPSAAPSKPGLWQSLRARLGL